MSGKSNNLDDYFSEYLHSIEAAYGILPKVARVRVEKWIDKLCEPTSIPKWKHNRNEHTELLLHCVRNRDFKEPFNRAPDFYGPLGNLPAHLRLFKEPQGAQLKVRSAQHTATEFWDSVYLRVHNARELERATPRLTEYHGKGSSPIATWRPEVMLRVQSATHPFTPPQNSRVQQHNERDPHTQNYARNSTQQHRQVRRNVLVDAPRSAPVHPRNERRRNKQANQQRAHRREHMVEQEHLLNPRGLTWEEEEQDAREFEEETEREYYNRHSDRKPHRKSKHSSGAIPSWSAPAERKAILLASQRRMSQSTISHDASQPDIHFHDASSHQHDNYSDTRTGYWNEHGQEMIEMRDPQEFQKADGHCVKCVARERDDVERDGRERDERSERMLYLLNAKFEEAQVMLLSQQEIIERLEKEAEIQRTLRMREIERLERLHTRERDSESLMCRSKQSEFENTKRHERYATIESKSSDDEDAGRIGISTTAARRRRGDGIAMAPFGRGSKKSHHSSQSALLGREASARLPENEFLRYMDDFAASTHAVCSLKAVRGGGRSGSG